MFSTTYMNIWEADPDLMKLLGDEIKFNEFKADGSDCPGRLDAPVLVKGVDGAVAVQAERVRIQLRQVVQVRRGGGVHRRGGGGFLHRGGGLGTAGGDGALVRLAAGGATETTAVI